MPSGTFSTDPSGPGTWVSKAGKDKRIDYVAIPQDWLCYVKSARVGHNVALAMADRLDHRVPRVDVVLPKDTQCRNEAPTFRPTAPSTDILKLPLYSQTIEEQWSSARPALPHWTIDFHDEILATLLRITWLDKCPITKTSQTPVRYPSNVGGDIGSRKQES